MTLPQGRTFLLMASTLLAAVSSHASSLIDPTRPVSTPKKATSAQLVTHSGWTLESTLVAADRRVAMINGKLVSEGESVDGARVVKISKLDVLVQTPDKRITLQLLPDIVMRIP